MIDLTVSELVSKLLECDPELPVRIYADHGQHDMSVEGVGLCYTPEDLTETYMVESSYGSLQEAAESGWTEEELSPFICIS